MPQRFSQSAHANCEIAASNSHIPTPSLSYATHLAEGETRAATAVPETLATKAIPRYADNCCPSKVVACAVSPTFLRSYRLHYDFVENALETKANTLDRATYFLFYLVFVIGFCFYFLYDVDVSARYQLRHSLLDTLSHAELPRLKQAKLFSELSSASEYSEYIVYAVAPLLASLLSPTGSSVPLGAMRVRTQRRVTPGCDHLPADSATSLYAAFTCKGSAASVRAGTRFDSETLWIYRSCAAVGGRHKVRLHGALDSYGCGGFMFDSPLWVARDNASLARQAVTTPSSFSARNNDTVWKTVAVQPALGTAEQAFPFTGGALPYTRISLQVLQDSYLYQLFYEAAAPFLDNYATRMAVTEVLFYNPPLQRFATVKLMGEVTSSGSWKTTALLRTARVWTSEDVGKGVYDVVVMLLALVWLVVFVTRAVLFVQRRVDERIGGGGGVVAAHKRARDTGGLGYSAVATVRIMVAVEYVFDPPNLSTAVILCLLVVTAGYRIASVVYSARAVPTLDKMIFQDRYPVQLEYLFYLEHVQLYVNAVIVLLLFYRGLCFVTVNTHAARFVRLLVRAQSALCGYLFLSLTVTTVYALALTALYAGTVWGFRDVGSAFYNLLRVMVHQHDISALSRDAADPMQLAFILYSYYVFGALATFSVVAGIFLFSFAEMRKEEPSTAIAAYDIHWLLHRLWKCVSQPRRWPWLGWRWCTGYGDAALLRHAARSLRGYRATRYSGLNHVEGERSHLLNLDEFIEAMHHGNDAQWLSETRSDCHSGIWMTWTSQLTTSGSSGSEDMHARRSRPLFSVGNVSGSRFALSDDRSSESFAFVKSKLPAEEREQRRRRWQQRWGVYSPEDVWREVYCDWLASTTSEASRYYKEEIVWLRNGVHSVVGNNLSQAKAFPQRLAELERKLKLLESHFREQELTTVVADSVDRDERCANTR